MIIPYSTDAPIYYFPWMTIVLIVVNAMTFAITAMGLHSQGWLLTYGNGLHPLEWLAYNFLHFGPMHLIGNMFFLWAFGIVVEGKLGWWKFLLLYLSIGVLGGVLIQTAMLGYVRDLDLVSRDVAEPGTGVFRQPAPNQWLWSDNSLYAQDLDFDAEMDDDPADAKGVARVRQDGLPNGRLPNFADADGEANDEDLQFGQAGAGGASLIIYGLMAIVLVWAPRNEIHCLWIGIRSGTFEFEYLYFCGFYIVIELLSAVISSRGFDATSEVLHAVGALIGGGLGVLFVKQRWVDCESWDLFSIMQGKHHAMAHVGEWHRNYLPGSTERRDLITALGDNAPDPSNLSNVRKKKKKAKPKLVELDSLDDPSESDDDLPVADVAERTRPKVKPSDVTKFVAPVTERDRNRRNSAKESSRQAFPEPPPIPGQEKNSLVGPGMCHDPVARVRQLLFEGEIGLALEQFRECREADRYFRLPQEELRMMANELFKRKAVPESAALLEEYVQRFRDDAGKQRVKLAVLYVKYLRKPTAALKQLAVVDANSLPDDYRSIYRTAAREAQQMVADGVTDAAG